MTRIFFINISYLSLVLALSLYSDKQIECNIETDLILQSSTFIYIIGVLFVKIKWYFILNTLCILSLFTLKFEFEEIKYEYIKLFTDLQFEFLRYGIFYLFICNTIKNSEDAKKILPYSGVVSNFGYIIQTRFSKINDAIISLWRRDFLSIIFTLVSLLLSSQINIHFEKLYLYNEHKKIKRGIVQSLLLFSSLTTTKFITNNIKVDLLTNIKLYDVIPFVGSFLIILLNQKHFIYTNYKFYHLFGILVNISFLLLKIFIDIPDYLNKLCIVLCWGSHFLINNPSRYILYIPHSVEIIHQFIAIDLFMVMLSNIVILVSNNIYTIVSIILLWISTVIYSLKYYKKDIYCEECVKVLQV